MMTPADSAPARPDANAAFSVQKIDSHELARVTLEARFNVDEWPGFERYFRAQLEAGIQNWDLDLRALGAVNSMFLGLLVGFNTIVTSHGGKARFLVDKDSQVCSLMNLSRLHRIMHIQEL